MPMEGEVVVITDIDEKLIECTVYSKYEFKGRMWLVLKSVIGNKEFRRPEVMFLKPTKVSKLSQGERPQ